MSWFITEPAAAAAHALSRAAAEVAEKPLSLRALQHVASGGLIVLAAWKLYCKPLDVVRLKKFKDRAEGRLAAAASAAVDGGAAGEGGQASLPAQELTSEQLLAKEITKGTIRAKVMFTASVLNIAVSGYLLACQPKFVRWFYGAKAFAYLGWRLLDYTRQSYHYFLLDFCYFSNALTLLLLFHPALRGHERLGKLCYSFSFGPLLFAIPVWGNRLVFHSVDAMTSIFIHFVPAWVLWHARFWDGELSPGEQPLFAADATLSWGDGVLAPLVAYACWQAVYAVKVYVVDRNYWADDPAVTLSFKYLTDPRNARRGGSVALIQRFIGLLGDGYAQKVTMFMVFQLVYTVVTLVPATLSFNYKQAGRAMGLGVLAMAAWAGAGAYVDAFRHSAERQAQRKVRAPSMGDKRK